MASTHHGHWKISVTGKETPSLSFTVSVKLTIKIPDHYFFCLHLHAFSSDSYITFLIRSLSHCIDLTITLWFITLSDLIFLWGTIGIKMSQVQIYIFLSKLTNLELLALDVVSWFQFLFPSQHQGNVKRLMFTSPNY